MDTPFKYAAIFVLLVIVLGSTAAFLMSEEKSDAPDDSGDSFDLNSRISIAVDKGLKFLASRQSKTGLLGSQYQVFVTSVAGLAFLASGNLPGEGKYGTNIHAARRYIVNSTTKVGYVCEDERSGGASRMHGHGFATWFLAELYGTSRQSGIEVEEEVKTILKKAIDVIESSQSNEGGWYYTPQKGGDEGSITVCIVQALRAARNIGLNVNKQVIDRGVDYLKKSANPDGSFKYSLGSGGGGTFPLASGGVSSLCLYGLYDAPETLKGLEYMMKHKPGTPNNWSSYPYYSNFYATLAMFLAGEKYWNEWFPLEAKMLLEKQEENGSWPNGEGGSPEYSTALACLTLQIPLQYLPLFHK
ncbi:MAG: terpene cyclase/mutase family protein [Planctomycetes bacterium]|nr:terpene cyclase/mutase family protein [Planctomycetota bacterium]